MGNNPNYWRAAIIIAPEAKFEGGKKCSDITLAISMRIIDSLEH